MRAQQRRHLDAGLYRFLSRPHFFFDPPPPPQLYTLSLHDALPIWLMLAHEDEHIRARDPWLLAGARSEEHTSELQSLTNLVCRLLLEKKKKHNKKSSATNHRSTPEEISTVNSRSRAT